MIFNTTPNVMSSIYPSLIPHTLQSHQFKAASIYENYFYNLHFFQQLFSVSLNSFEKWLILDNNYWHMILNVTFFSNKTVKDSKLFRKEIKLLNPFDCFLINGLHTGCWNITFCLITEDQAYERGMTLFIINLCVSACVCLCDAICYEHA